MSRRHTHAEDFDVTVEQLFDLLVTPSSIRQWWGAARAIVIKQQGGAWTAAWGENEDDPDYISHSTIQSYEPPHRLVLCDNNYYAKSGALPFEAEFITEFLITKTKHGSRLQVTQNGFPLSEIADDYYQACEAGWKDTFAGLRTFLESKN